MVFMKIKITCYIWSSVLLLTFTCAHRVPSILPMLKPCDVVNEAMDAILTDQRYVYSPGYFFRPAQILRT